MPVPFESLIPYGIIIVMFGVSGAGMGQLRSMQNSGKRARRSVDQWDRQSTADQEQPNDNAREDITRLTFRNLVMDRDRRLTGMLRGQTDKPEAPPGFELNNPWKLENRFS